MKRVTKFLLLMIAVMLSSTMMLAQGSGMSAKEKAEIQKIEMQQQIEHGPSSVVPPSRGVAAVGDDCTTPIVVTAGPIPYSYSDLGQTTCGRGNNYPDTDLGLYDGGDDIIYELVISETADVTIQMDPGVTTWTGLGLFTSCPDIGNSVAIATGAAASVREINAILVVGTYYIMASTFPTPDCIPSFDLTITTAALPLGPEPITAFPFSEDFESGVFPLTMIPLSGSDADLTLSAAAAESSSFGALFEGGSFSNWTSYSTVDEAFGNTAHVAKLQMNVVPSGDPGLLTMEFDLLQKYTWSTVNYEWFRVTVNGNAIADINGNFWQQASSEVSDQFAPVVYDLSAYQVLGSFDLNIENAGKYSIAGTAAGFGEGDVAFIDNFELFYLTIGDMEGYVMNGDGLTISGATVGIDGFGTTTTDGTGYYSLVGINNGSQEGAAGKAGYNTVTETVNIPSGATLNKDWTLTKPSLTINPLFFDETLAPNEYLTTYLGILNTGDGAGDWDAVINYISKAPGSITNVTGQTYPVITSTSNDGPALSKVNGEPVIPSERSRDLFECNATSLFGNSPAGATNAFWSQYGGTFQQYQQVNGVSEAWTTITFWGVFLSGTPTTEEFFIGVYEDGGSTYGAEIASYLIELEPINTGEVLLGSYPIYQYIAVIDAQTATDFWVSCQATAQMYWANSLTGSGNSTTGAEPCAVCIDGGSFGGWLSLGDYAGTVPGNGGSQNVAVNFNATGAEVGEVYQAEIVMNTDPDVGTFTIPVTMTIYGDPLDPVTDLEAEVVNMVTGQVDLDWAFTTTNPAFQYFSIKRDGFAVGITTDLTYSDFPPAFGTYCYEVYPVFATGTGAPGGPVCVDWLIPALCWSPATMYNKQWPDSQEEVILTLENCGDGMLDFVFPDYVSGSRFACDMEIALYDSFGDGWNGCALDVFVNGNMVLSAITIATGNGPEYYSFPVEEGDDISTVFIPGGFVTETSYEIYDGYGTMVHASGPSSPSLPAGTVFGACPQPSYIIDVEPAMGQISGGSSLEIVLTYDATGFPAGIFDEWLNIETNDPLMLEDSIFNQMEVYIPGMFYGSVTDCNSGLGKGSVTVTATGLLGGVYTATTDGGGYYEMYVDEDTYDLDFTLLGFESAFVPAIFAPTGVMTEVNATMCETPYPVQWVFADPNLADTECMVTWTLPMGPYEIIYDDGEADDYVIWTQPGGAVGVHFTPAGYPANVIGGRLNVGDGSFPAGANFLGTDMAVGVMDDDGANGLPGTMLDSTIVTVNNYGWVDFYDYFNTPIEEGDFYIVMWQLGWATNSAPCAVDTDLPTVYRSVVMMPGMGTWSMSPYQDFMIRAYVDGPNAGVMSSAVGSTVRLPKVVEGPFLATSMPKGGTGTVKDGEFRPHLDENATRDMTNYTVARISNFDPVAGPATGTHTPIATPTEEFHNDLAYGGQPEGFYAYGVKAVYESNESVWVYSNTVGHLLDNEFTVQVSLCDGNDPDNAEVMLFGLEYPLHVLTGTTDIDGIVVFDSVIDGYYDLIVQKVGYTIYEHPGLPIFDDQIYSLVLTEKAYAPRNLMVEPLTSHATWDEPLITALYTETFEESTFPPMGWQSTTLGVGWTRTDDGSSANWTIPEGDGFYAMANDDAAGSVSDGSEDYLITPELDLRESDDFSLYFSSFYDATNGESAYIEYSFDAGATWEVLDALSPAGDWTDVMIDLGMISGIDSAPVWLAFHADDNGAWASGWAVDNVVVRNGPSPILGYYVYLNDAFVDQTAVDVLEYTFMDLAYGETYEACVRALYACGLSEEVCFTWNSTYLHPPRELSDEYIYGTNEVPLMWLPPMTGTIPMAAAFKVVYVGPQLHAVGPNVDAAPVVTVIEFENADNSRVMGDFQFSFPDADASGEAGCESDGDFIYTALWNGSNYIKYDLDGNMIESFGVAGTSGVRDLAYDGQFMYGAAANTTVYVMDFTTQTLITTFTAPTACRALAYNHDDQTFYGCDWATDIVNFDAAGNNLGSFSSGLTGVYGLAYDSWSGAAGEQFLWAYDQGANNLIQFALPAGTTTGVTLDVVAITGADPAAGAGGAYTQPELFSSDKVTIGGNSQNDMVWGIELSDYDGGGGSNPGQIPDGLVSFNLYQDGVNIANIPYEGQGVDEYVTHVVNPLDPNTYLFDVSAVYDLTIFGFPGDFGESAWEGTDTVEVVWGFDLPFYEGWDQGTFAFQGWRFNDNSENWVINSQVGAPEPAAQFNWDPLLEVDYSSSITSNPITGDLLTEGDIFLDFDIKLDDRNSTGEEKLLVEIYNGSSWAQVAEFTNTGSFDFTESHINISNYAMGRVFNVRFNAVGQNSFDVVAWLVDNINIYRECEAPTDLIGEYTWDATADYGAEICWEAPFVPGPIQEWIHWDDGTPFSGVGLTDGGTFSAAARWDAGQLSDYEGTSITKMQYIVAIGFTEVILKIWTGANAGTLVYEQDVTATSVVGIWNEVTLTAPVALDVDDELWIGYTITNTAGTFPAATDAGPAVVGYGDMITTDGSTWDPISSFDLDYNWSVQAFVQGSSASASVPMIDNTVYDTPEGTLARGPEVMNLQSANTTIERALTGFNIYRMEEGATEYELYDVVDHVTGQTTYCYYDAVPEVDPQMGYYYQVTCVYASDSDACESAAAMAYEIPMDDFVYVFVTGIDNPNAIGLTNIYPNPAQDVVTVTSSIPMNEVTVTNYVGQVVYNSEMFEATSVELNTSSYQAGVYLVKIDTDNGVVTKRVIITR